MPSDSISKTTAAALLGAYVAVVLAWGFFVAQQLLLAAFIAVLGSLVAGLLYTTWQYFGGSGGDGGELRA